VRQFRRPDRVHHIRIGNVLPDATGEIDTETRRREQVTPADGTRRVLETDPGRVN
jgi:hypothetical protein